MWRFQLVADFPRDASAGLGKTLSICRLRFPSVPHVRLQFIGEAFNALNHSNISGVRTTQFSRSTAATVCGIAGTPCLVPQNIGASAFGTPTATSGPRIMQLAVKFLF